MVIMLLQECVSFSDYLTSLHSEWPSVFPVCCVCSGPQGLDSVPTFLNLLLNHLLDHNNPISQLIRVNHDDLAMSLWAPSAVVCIHIIIFRWHFLVHIFISHDHIPIVSQFSICMRFLFFKYVVEVHKSVWHYINNTIRKLCI